MTNIPAGTPKLRAHGLHYFVMEPKQSRIFYCDTENPVINQTSKRLAIITIIIIRPATFIFQTIPLHYFLASKLKIKPLHC